MTHSRITLCLACALCLAVFWGATGAGWCGTRWEYASLQQGNITDKPSTLTWYDGKTKLIGSGKNVNEQLASLVKQLDPKFTATEATTIDFLNAAGAQGWEYFTKDKFQSSAGTFST